MKFTPTGVLTIFLSVLLLLLVFAIPSSKAKIGGASNQKATAYDVTPLLKTSSQANGQGTAGFWHDRDAASSSRQAGGPEKFRSLTLDTSLFQSFLERVPKEFTEAARTNKVILSMPAPDGGFLRFYVEESPIMAPELAARYPQIKTYRGQGIDDPSATTRFDWTPQGFHAIVLSTRGTILIEPDAAQQISNYMSYFQGDMPSGSMECDVSTDEQDIVAKQNLSNARIQPAAVSGANLRTYRLAVAATGEYTQRYGSGTIAGGLAAITTTVNLVDAIYETEVSIRFSLIPNEDSIIFTDSATDGYTSDNAAVMITENQTKLDAVIGNANYDIGHVFDGRSSGGGFSFQGIASIAAVCKSGVKGRGVSITRSVEPSSVIAYYSTAHEMGHQFGASHTFNATSGACASQRASTTAYEPGTGSTIMGYRFTCSPEDLRSSDTYFHNASLEQITAYSTVGSGNCPSPVATGNGIPTVNAGSNYTIPQNTPFTLTATGSDPDGDALTYAWEEYDLGNPGPPNTDDGFRPIFRSFAPVTSPSRTFPRLVDIQTGIPTFGESMPITTRTMNFRVTVRDNRASGGGINSAAMQLNVRSDAGPFTVTSPAAGAAWTTASTQTVTWNVANTNAAPVNCAAVKITLSLDGGNTFPIILANATPNDGSEIVTVPSTSGGNARVKVEAVGNVFFNMSGGFTINGLANPVPTITNFLPQTGATGATVTITGTNFITPSAVRFNGLAANFVVNSTTQIDAVVPAGNTNGPITVDTPYGTAISSASFAGPPTYFVSGQILGAGNAPLAGATVTFDLNSSGAVSSFTTVTDVSGNYSSANLGCQNRVAVTPFKVGFGFTPISTVFTSTSCLTGTATANFMAAQAGANNIKFSQSAYTVNEGAPSITATVTRTGDTSGSATVDVKTSDTDSFTVGCSDRVNNLGGAFGRCDYATTIDTLVFAGGETSKSVIVPIINDSFAEGNETFSLSLSNAAGATLGTPSSATITIEDNDAVDGPNPIFATSFFVRLQYLDFLSREPEPGEPWSAVLNGCSDVNNNPNCDRATVSAAFFGSQEFQLKGYFVYRFYKLAFNRLPSYGEIVVDMRAVTGSTPNEVFQKKAAFTDAFVQRLEFANTYNALSNASYVSTLMSRYGLSQITTPDPSAPDGANKVTFTTTDLTNQLTAGTLTRAQVLRAVADSDQVFAAEFNKAFVAMQYFGYLRRSPDTVGYNAWLNYLNANPTDFRTMVNGFMNSAEYRLRFGPQ